MQKTATTTCPESDAAVRETSYRQSIVLDPSEEVVSATTTGGGCYHCGAPLRGVSIPVKEKRFCCQGCKIVFELLAESGLTGFYNLGGSAGVRVAKTVRQGEFDYLDEMVVRERLVDFSDGAITRVTFLVPSMHCVACVWLLENLFRLHGGIGETKVNFPRREVFISFENSRIRLSELVSLLSSLGYAPELKLSDLETGPAPRVSRRMWLQLGFAGFAFGNIMLLSISSYLGLDAFSGPGFRRLSGWISLAVAAPVLFYSAADYWRSAWTALRLRMLTIDVPIALGIAALAAWSAHEVYVGRGVAYLDSLAGLLFFLLCGKLFQQITYDRLLFDRDYKSFFPLSILRKKAGREEQVSISQLRVGDRLIIRNGELIPCDSRLITGAAVIDYSFVTGESEPVGKISGDPLYAGGRQTGGVIEIDTVKTVSQSYLTSLWNQPAFLKERGPGLDTVTNRYSRRFTKVILAVAIGAAIFWWFADPSRSLVSFVSVLIVACPCALALAAPFTLGTAQRVLSSHKVFLKNPAIIETLAQVDSVVFDKTGTLTASADGVAVFEGVALGEQEQAWVFSLSRQSHHPCATAITRVLDRGKAALASSYFVEIPGSGVCGVFEGHEVWLGSAAMFATRGIAVGDAKHASGSVVYVAIDGCHRGSFRITSGLRPDTSKLIKQLSRNLEISLLSGDNEKEQGRFRKLFGEGSRLRFNQSPMNKLGFIRELQESGKKVMMVGDGLNDAGALRQSDVGVAVVESVGAFSPASDVILSADMVPRLHEILKFAENSVGVVRASFLISSLYNLVGIGLAASGLLSPIICAILMPVSSVSVVVFACCATRWMGRRLGAEADSMKETDA
jgi:Cu+-exporting ATPase